MGRNTNSESRNINAFIVPEFRKFVSRRARLAGVDISNLEISGATLDSIWGDLVGYIFHGCTDEVNKRVADSFLAFASKHMSPGTLQAQRAIRSAGVRYLHSYTHGLCHWSIFKDPSPWASIARPSVKGYAVATTYFPCTE
jgi:hypothetical protein